MTKEESEKIDGMPAGPDMDRLIAEKVMGCHVLTLAESMDRAFGYDGSSRRCGEFFCGCPRRPHETEDNGDGYNHWLTLYSTDLNAAVEATEALAPIAPGASAACSWRFRLLRDQDRGYWADVWTVAEDASWQAGAPTPALALCRALLKAIS